MIEPVAKLGTFDFCRNLRTFTDPITTDPASQPSEYGTYILSDAKWYISTSQNFVSVAAKAGHNGESHNHNDVGSFQLFKNGEQLLLDIGAGDYSRSYFSKNRYTDHYCCCSRGHSVPIVNGKYQSNGASFSAKDTEITIDGITSDISGAYDEPSLTSLVRELRFDRDNGVLTLTDCYDFLAPPKSVTERFIIGNAPIIEDGEVTVKVGDESIRIVYDHELLEPVHTVLERTNSNGSRSLNHAIDFTVKHPEGKMKFTFTVL